MPGADEPGPALAQIPGVTRVSAADGPSGGGFEVESDRGTDVRREIARAVVNRGWGLLELRPMRMSLEEIFLQVTTDETPQAAGELAGEAAAAQTRPEASKGSTNEHVRNILAIAGKELRSYFASPIAYIIIGLFALLFGWFFYVYLHVFVEQSQRMAMMGGGNVNVNEQMIRGVLQNAAVIILFVMPMITMRTYSEEKRSGTIELLLTSPLTDFEIILGKFLGAMGLFCAMLARHDDRHRDPVPPREPRVAADRGRLSRAAADGRLLHLGRAADLEPDEESDRRRLHDVRGLPDAVGHQLARGLLRADRQAMLSFLSITDHFDDFTKGIIDTKHLVVLPELHHFRPVPDRQVGRLRALARLIW